MIHTQEEIDKKVRRLTGCTWIKRRNLRRRLTKESNKEVDQLISTKKTEARKLFIKEYDKADIYAEISKLEQRRLEPCL